ncbi:MAG TPA: serine hydrolase domain-containing protein [Polyangiaceae bacterium]
MPSLGFASTAAATAIDQAVKTALDTPRFKHSQFPYGRWPAFTIAIRQGTRLVFSKAYGFSDWGADPVLAHADDRMRLASDSKQLTGAAIYKLIHDGQIIPGLGTKLTLQTSVFQVLSSAPNAILPPGGKSAIVPDLMNVTVEDLLHHTSGISGGDPTAYNGPNLPPSEDDVVKMIMTTPPGVPHGVFFYDNANYNLLARLVTKVSGIDYETYVKTHVLAPLGITRMQVGGALLSQRADDEDHYYAHYNSPPERSLYPAQTGATLVGDDVIPYGDFSLQAGRGAGGWIASTLDELRFQLGVDGLGPTQVYPNIYSDLNTETDQPVVRYANGQYSLIDRTITRYNAGWGFNKWGPEWNSGWEMSHGGGVNGTGTFTEGVPYISSVPSYGWAFAVNTTGTVDSAGNTPDIADPIRSAWLGVLYASGGSLLGNLASDTDFFDQYGDYTEWMPETYLSDQIYDAADGCTYKGQSYPHCYAARIEGRNPYPTPLFRAQIVPLHAGDTAARVIQTDCLGYLSSNRSYASAGYNQVSLQFYRNTSGRMRIQSVWVKLH